MKGKKTLWADIILIASVLLVGAVSLTALLLFKKDGSYAVVEIDGKQVAKYSLGEDGEYPLNGGTNILKIEKGKAYMLWADCPDKTCVQRGKVSAVGESIICLPNRVAVYIEGKSQNGAELVS